MEVAPNVHQIVLNFVNAYLIVDADGLTLIDTGMPGSDKKILEYISGIDRLPDELKRIILTHSDIDHIGSLAALKAASGARTYANTLEAEGIAKGKSTRPLKGRGLRLILFKLLMPMFKAKPVKVDEALSDGQVLPVLGGLQVVNTFGHTPGHISLYSPSTKILFGGDSMRSSGDGLMPSPLINTWDEARMLEAIKVQAALGAEIVCVGHGSVIKDATDKFPQM
jgi:glyoxylase-like metal-dependent hydrolase (beta-lactamase superfamily II)